MPLDRVVTLRVQDEGTRNEYDEFVPGAITEYPVWAEIQDAGSVDEEDEGGIRVVHRRGFTIRWRRDVLTAGPVRVSIRDEYNRLYNVEEISEITDQPTRRRFVTITGVEST